jgi:DNA-binding MarR family transcriptional regulator
MVSGMVDRGWIGRDDNPSDRRAVRLVLLPAGRDVFDGMVERARAHLAEWLRELTEDELGHLQAGLAGLERLAARQTEKGKDCAK